MTAKQAAAAEAVALAALRTASAKQVAARTAANAAWKVWNTASAKQVAVWAAASAAREVWEVARYTAWLAEDAERAAKLAELRRICEVAA